MNSTGGLVESVNHNLRTPLTVVWGHAELLIDPERELPAEVHQLLASVHACSPGAGVVGRT
jgi:K+-sensing histidine kinase KdpD